MPEHVPDPTMDSSNICNVFSLVSIVIPCFNGAEFISEAIESALAQTHPRVEVIVIDDGSVDNSGEIIARYPVVRCFHGRREGVSAARNRGVRESRGDYIVFLDADDRLLPDAVCLGLTALMEHPECCMTVGSHNSVSRSGTLLHNRKKPVIQSDYYALLLKASFIECTSSAMFRREIFSVVGWMNTRLSAAEDYDFYLRLAREHSICCHSGVVSEYRFHETNASHNSELMLISTLGVIHAQLPYVFKSLKRCYYFSCGLWLWRRQYGRQLTRELATRQNKGSATRGLRPWLTLACNYPIGVPIALAFHALPRETALGILYQTGHSKPSLDVSPSL